jgi:hypothetical protein
MSDASLKHGQCSHAWMLTTGDPEHLTNQNMYIQGAGAVDSDTSMMSSTRGELHGQTAMAIMSDIFLTAHNDTTAKIVLYGDNKGVQQVCSTIQVGKLKHHRQPNMDLKLEYKNASSKHHITNEWIKGHQDKDREWQTISDLQNMKLSNTAILNTICDRKANET